MQDTKEKILRTALLLFARDGYEAVSVSMIAGQLGITKGALYKHYENKRAILECIVARMEAEDAQRATAYAVPVGTVDAMPCAYRDAARWVSDGAWQSDRDGERKKEYTVTTEAKHWTEYRIRSAVH